MFTLPTQKPFMSSDFKSAACLLRYGKCWYQLTEPWQDLVYPYLPVLDLVSDEVFIRSGGAVLVKLAPQAHAASGKLAEELPTDVELAAIGSVAATAIQLFKSGAQIPELDPSNQLKLFMQTVGMNVFTQEFRLAFKPEKYIQYRESEINDQFFLESIVRNGWYAQFFNHCFSVDPARALLARKHLPLTVYKGRIFWTVERLTRVLWTWDDASLRNLATACGLGFVNAGVLMMEMNYPYMERTLVYHITKIMPHEGAW